ncbi:hypothetical protein [Tenacibaculum sp. SDUM215027]|uniref:hypothetical protein n=1 Tax=Tenacibaculum sp. SDUM215027 TaxID=3422596 RepID=UPI003D31074A
MKKSILNIGKSLNKEKQKLINGGSTPVGLCDSENSCPTGYYCEGIYCYKDYGDNDNGDNSCTGPWQFCPNGGVSCTGC